MYHSLVYYSHMRQMATIEGPHGIPEQGKVLRVLKKHHVQECNVKSVKFRLLRFCRLPALLSFHVSNFSIKKRWSNFESEPPSLGGCFMRKLTDASLEAQNHGT